jgi:hypothetical protein
VGSLVSTAEGQEKESPDEPCVTARAGAVCGRDITHRRLDAKTCGGLDTPAVLTTGDEYAEGRVVVPHLERALKAGVTSAKLAYWCPFDESSLTSRRGVVEPTARRDRRVLRPDRRQMRRRVGPAGGARAEGRPRGPVPEGEGAGELEALRRRGVVNEPERWRVVAKKQHSDDVWPLLDTTKTNQVHCNGACWTWR